MSDTAIFCRQMYSNTYACIFYQWLQNIISTKTSFQKDTRNPLRPFYSILFRKEFTPLLKHPLHLLVARTFTQSVTKYFLSERKWNQLSLFVSVNFPLSSHAKYEISFWHTYHVCLKIYFALFLWQFES